MAVAVRMAKEGYALSLSGRDETALKDVANQCTEAGATGVRFLRNILY